MVVTEAGKYCFEKLIAKWLQDKHFIELDKLIFLDQILFSP